MYGEVFFNVSLCVLLPHHWIVLEKLPENDPSCLNLSIGSKVVERFSSVSADVYSDLTIGSALKNYPKRTLHMLESVHWFQSYGEVFFHVS